MINISIIIIIIVINISIIIIIIVINISNITVQSGRYRPLTLVTHYPHIGLKINFFKVLRNLRTQKPSSSMDGLDKKEGMRREVGMEWIHYSEGGMEWEGRDEIRWEW